MATEGVGTDQRTAAVEEEESTDIAYSNIDVEHSMATEGVGTDQGIAPAVEEEESADIAYSNIDVEHNMATEGVGTDQGIAPAVEEEESADIAYSNIDVEHNMATEGVGTDQGIASAVEEEESADIACADIAFLQSQGSSKSEETSQNLDNPELGKGETTSDAQVQSVPTGSREVDGVCKSQIFPQSEVRSIRKDSLSYAISQFLAAEAEVQAQLHMPAQTQSGRSSFVTTQEERTGTSERTQERHKEDEVGDDVAMVTEAEMTEVKMDEPLKEESVDMEYQ